MKVGAVPRCCQDCFHDDLGHHDVVHDAEHGHLWAWILGEPTVYDLTTRFIC